MKVATQDEVAANFAGYVKATKNGPVLVMSKGKPVAVLLRSESDDDVERLLMGHWPEVQAILERARKRFREGRGISHDVFWKEMQAENASDSPKQTRTTKQSRGRR